MHAAAVRAAAGAARLLRLHAEGAHRARGCLLLRRAWHARHAPHAAAGGVQCSAHFRKEGPEEASRIRLMGSTELSLITLL